MSGLPAGCEPIDLAALPARPWKNGTGLTHEIATHPRGAGLDDFDWRLSVAEVAGDGPFSAFSGVERQIVLLEGGGMQLRSHDGAIDQRLDQPGSLLRFAGEAAIEACLLQGPTRDVNVMTRRGRWQAEVHSLREPGRIAAADALLLLCCAGAWTIEPGRAELPPGRGLLWRTPVAALAARPRLQRAGPWLLAVRLCQDRAP